MTIKQQGGVFGRNPTFNDVDVEGTLTVGGSAIPSPADTLTSSDIGSTVQGFDADTAKTDTAQTFTAKQDVTFAGGGNYIATFQNTTSATPYGVQIKDAASGAAGYPLLNITNSAGSTEYFKVNSGTNPNIAVGKNLTMANGYGIDFSATSGTGTSELFDDYEEGVFNVAFVTTSGSITISSTADTMSYTKIGNIVHIQGYLASSAVSSPSGDLKITGLPFTSANGIAELGDYAVGTVWLTGTSADIDGGVIAYIPAGSTDLFFRVNAVSGANNTVASSVDSGTEFMIGLTYTAA